MNNEIANKIFDAIYDECDLKELKDKKVIAQELGFKLSTVAIIECEIDEYLNKNYDKLVDFVVLVANATVSKKVTEDKIGMVNHSDVISHLYKELAVNVLKELGHEI